MTRVLLSIGSIQALIILVNLGRSKALSTLIGPAGFGIVSTIDQVILTAIHVCTLSLPFTAMRFMARSHSEGDGPFQQTFATFLKILAILSVAAAVVVSVVVAWRPGLFGDDLGAYRGELQIAILGLPFVALNLLFINTLAAAQRPTASAALTFVVALVLAIAAIVGVLIDDIRGLYLATTGAGLVMTIATLAYLRSSLHLPIVARPDAVVESLRQDTGIVKFALMVYVAVSAYSVTLLWTRFVVLSRLGEAQAGFFQAQLSIALTIGAVLNPLSNLYLAPLVNRQTAAASKATAATEFARIMVMLLLMASLPAVLFPKLAMTVLFSPAFAPAAGAIYLFVVWQFVYQVANVYQQLLIGLDDVFFCTAAMTVSYAAGALALPALIDSQGLAGAAIALALIVGLSGFAAVWRLRSKFAVSVPVEILSRAAVCLALIVTAGLTFNSVSEWTPRGVLARGGYALAAIGVLLVLATGREKEAMLAAVRKLRNRA